MFGVLSPAAMPQKDSSRVAHSGLNTYGGKCHNSTPKTGGDAFDELRPEDIPKNAELFEKVVMKL